MNEVLNFIIQVGLDLQANPFALLLVGIPLAIAVMFFGRLRDNDPRG